MANFTSKQILEDGYRNAVVKLAGILDTSDVSLVPAVSLSDFTSNDPGGTLVGFRVDFLDYSSGPNLVTSVEWQSNSPQLIAAFAQSDELDFQVEGGALPDKTITGYTGNISLKTRGYIAGAIEAYTLILRLVKLYQR